MEFKEYLVSKGITEEQASTIVEGMPAEKYYLASEEKLDDRYTKLKQQKEQLEEQLTSNQAELNTLKESAKDNTELTQQLTELQTKFDESEKNSIAAMADKDKSYAIQSALREANALDDSLVIGLLDKDTIKVTDEGVQGLKEQLEQIREKKAFLFKQEDEVTPTPQIVTTGNLNATSGKELDPFEAKMAKYQ
jgi:molecular chaperone GrpE (heat shock protein)